MPVDFWTLEQTEMMKERWMAGLTAREVAEQLTEAGYKVTKNSVIGKVHRMKLDRGPVVRTYTPPCHKPKPEPQPKRSANDPIQRMINRRRAFQRYEIHNGHRRGKMDNNVTRNVLLLDAKDGQCRAILGYKDGQKAQAICCGSRTPWVTANGRSTRSSWCEHHRNEYLTDRGKKYYE